MYKIQLDQGAQLVFPYVRNGLSGTNIVRGVNLGPSKLNMSPPPPWTDQRQILANLYPKGYQKTRPGNSVANVGQFLVELRDLPTVPGLGNVTRKLRVPLSQVPSVLRGQLRGFQNLGSEYLNVVFGWKPFVSDVRKMYNLWHKIDREMAKIIRENGKGIHRKATVSREKTSTQPPGTSYNLAYVSCHGAPPNMFGVTGSTVVKVTSTFEEHVWFSARYRYYIPNVSSSQWNRRARLALFGGLPTPEVLWEVLPWSWLVDWFSNVGDVVSNASPNAVDNLTMSHSYIMRHVRETTQWTAETHHPPRNTGAGTSFPTVFRGVDFTFSTTETVEIKSRYGGGNPFGLNVGLSTLSGGQLAILAALGISRGLVK